jgi:hypothetical protein
MCWVGWVTGPARAVRVRPNLTIELVVLALVPPVRCGVVKGWGPCWSGVARRAQPHPGLPLALRRPGPGAVKGRPQAERALMSAQRPLTAEGPGWHPPGLHGSAGPCGAAKGGRGPRTAAKRVGRSLPRATHGGYASSCRWIGGGQDAVAKAGKRRLREAQGGWVVEPWRLVPLAPPRAGRHCHWEGRTGTPPPAGKISHAAGGEPPGRWGSSAARTCGS